MKSKPTVHRILVVEDDPDDRTLLTELLTRTIPNGEIKSVGNGHEAMQYLEAAGVLPSLIILDIFMPQKNGFEVLQEIKDNPRFRTIPILVLSCSSASKDIWHSYSIGANAYLVKPSTEDELNRFVNSIYSYWFANVQSPVYRRSNT